MSPPRLPQFTREELILISTLARARHYALELTDSVAHHDYMVRLQLLALKAEDAEQVLAQLTRAAR